MALVSMLDELNKAQAGGYAVPCFNTFEMMGSNGTLAAAAERRAPIFLGCYTRWLDGPDADAFWGYVCAQAAKSAAPVGLILDHGDSLQACLKALSLGFTGVMFDGSRLPLEENIATTRTVARAAHALGAICEGEVGHVGAGSEYDKFGALGRGFSDPAEVERFVEETGVDCVAVAVGTAHGEYNCEPRLALELLAEIRRRVAVPLVLHGGSGLSDEQFRTAIETGVAKVNVFTDLALHCAAQLVSVASRERPSYFDFTGGIREAFQQRSGYYIDLFARRGKA